MTKKDALTIALTTLTASVYPNPSFDGKDTTRKEIPVEEVREAITKMIASLDKASATPRKLSPKEIAQQEQNAIFRANVYKAMGEEPNRLWQVKELADRFEVSAPKMSAALTALRKANLVKRDEGFNGRVITFQYLPEQK